MGDEGLVKVFDEGIRYFNDNGVLHRVDGPAVINWNGSEYWYLNGKSSRENGSPAIVRADGSEVWLRDGLYHRVDGPAIIQADGEELWMLNGVKHRTDGPAVVSGDGSVEYWVDGNYRK